MLFRSVAVSGSIELRNYEDSQGVKRTGVDIVAQDVEFLTPRGTTGEGYNDAPSAPAEKKRASLQAFDDDSDIPF